ncbi:DUF6586 family protein [uncultured Gilvimarinus sp.]|uniref:DUF6586 family protein n=1 Tax=uncultured Gilvimarinus sp. TaxID=1689143 RepID=UPI0030EF5995|tara:strand:- start:1231 stop:1725 length:495 start_codon:yes stop_codon:yes gene_type:complete
MASLAAQVNRRIASARVILAELAGAERTPFARQALLEAALFHLYCGYNHYLRELCAYYGVKSVASIKSASDAALALKRLDKQPAEMSEISELAARPDSWLSQLAAGYQACWASDSGADAAADNLIQVHHLDDQVLEALDESLLVQWLAQMQALVERHRQSTTEY